MKKELDAFERSNLYDELKADAGKYVDAVQAAAARLNGIAKELEELDFHYDARGTYAYAAALRAATDAARLNDVDGNEEDAERLFYKYGDPDECEWDDDDEDGE